MQQLSRWFYLNKLVINPDKTTAISFHAWQNKSNLKCEIAFRDMDSKYKNETKFLGLHLTEDVKWDVHIKHVCNILNKTYCVIHSLKKLYKYKYFQQYIFCKLSLTSEIWYSFLGR